VANDYGARISSLERAFHFYRGAFWLAAVLFGGAAVTIIGHLRTIQNDAAAALEALEAAKNSAIAEVLASNELGKNGCKFLGTFWAFERIVPPSNSLREVSGREKIQTVEPIGQFVLGASPEDQDAGPILEFGSPWLSRWQAISSTVLVVETSTGESLRFARSSQHPAPLFFTENRDPWDFQARLLAPSQCNELET
jgi:hypothetical protein